MPHSVVWSCRYTDRVYARDGQLRESLIAVDDPAVPGAPDPAVPGIPGVPIPGIPGVPVPGIPGVSVPGIPGVSVPGVQVPSATAPSMLWHGTRDP